MYKRQYRNLFGGWLRVGKRWLVRCLLCIAVLAALLQVPAGAHTGLKTGRYECWLSAITTYSNFDLKIQSGGKYVWMRHDGTAKKPGKFEKNGQRIRFTSGYLKNQNFKGLHDSFIDSFDIHTHMIYLYKNKYDSDNLKYDCNNN